MEASGSTPEHGLDGLDPATTPARDAVAAARAAGDSWTIVAAALDITRRAAWQRFEHLEH